MKRARRSCGLSLGTAATSVRLGLPATLRSLRAAQRARDDEQRARTLGELRGQVGHLRDSFQSAQLQLPATICRTLVNLLATLAANPQGANVSNLRTVAHALDFLNRYTSSNVLFSDFSQRPIKVLVIEDNDVCRAALKLALKSRELKVTGCASGEEALSLLPGTHFELVISDIMMPGIDGFKVVYAIRKLPQYARVPVVFVTVLSDFETRSKSVVNGVVDLIAKPFMPSEVALKALTLGWGARLDLYSHAPR